jgi:thiamine biosynthesis lipoprotein
MGASQAALLGRPTWSRVGTGSRAVAAADRDALGTTARIVVWPPRNLSRLLAVVDDELATLDRQASRFRPDSEISLVHAGGAGRHVISDGLAEAVGIALAAARWTAGRCDPAVGGALISLGYDRDFADIAPGASTPMTGAGWPGGRPAGDLAAHRGQVPARLDGNLLELAAGVRLDLGATAKGLGADRAARAAYAAAGEGGVLVSLGGDLAVAGQPPAGGWPLLVADEHRQTRAARNLSPAGRPGQPAGEADPVTAQLIRLASGGLATSSVTCRQWRRAGELLHHIIDPRTAMPADGPWRTVSVVAASCAEANAASTAAIVAGADAQTWLSAQGLPARLIGHDGSVGLTGGWPAADGGQIVPPTTSLLPAGQPPANPDRKE